MPYKDPETAKADERRKRRRDRRREKRLSLGLPADGRGKHGNHARGNATARWNTGKLLSTDGYVMVRVGRGHSLADPNGYAFEHLVVWVSAGNERPSTGSVLHHTNHDKTDNRIENLQLLKTSVHNQHHNGDKKRDKLGRFSTTCESELKHNDLPWRLPRKYDITISEEQILSDSHDDSGYDIAAGDSSVEVKVDEN